MKTLLRSTTAYRSILAESARGERSHAILVLFPDGKYLRDLMKECAKAFFCAKDGERTEELVEKESYADCIFLPAAGEKLTADDCARISEESLLRPVEGEYKLFVLDNFHTASAIVQNKLLKLLEEPPAGVHFLLGAESEFPVLPTVLSRVRKFSVPPFPEEEVERALVRKYGTKDAKAAAAASGGIFSVAEGLLADGGEDFRLAEEFLSLKDAEIFCRKTGERKNKREFFAALKSLLRDLLLFSAGEGKYASRDVGALAKNYRMGALIAALELVNEAEKQIQFNANFATCLYSLALSWKEVNEKWKRLP